MTDSYSLSPALGIHISNALHNKKINLITEEVWDCFIEAIFGSLSEVDQRDEQKLRRHVRAAVELTKAAFPDHNQSEFEANSTYLTLYTVMSFSRLQGNFPSITWDSLGRGNQTTTVFGPGGDSSLRKEQMDEMIGVLQEDSSFYRQRPKYTAHWTTEDSDVIGGLKADAERWRNKLGLDHIPINEEVKEQYQVLITLNIRLNDSVKMYRPTILNGPGLRHRTLSNRECDGESITGYGYTVDLDDYEDGMREIILEFGEQADLNVKAVTGLGVVTEKHPNAAADKHEYFFEALKKNGDDFQHATYEKFNGCTFDAYFEALERRS